MKIATGTQVSKSLERLNSYLDTLVSSATKNHASASMTDENREESCYAYSIEADRLLNIDHHETPMVPIELKPHIDLTCICTEAVGNVSRGNNVTNEFVIKEAPVPSKELLAEADPSLRENVRISCQGEDGFGAVVCDEMSGNADEVTTEVNPTVRGSVPVQSQEDDNTKVMAVDEKRELSVDLSSEVDANVRESVHVASHGDVDTNAIVADENSLISNRQTKVNSTVHSDSEDSRGNYGTKPNVGVENCANPARNNSQEANVGDVPEDEVATTQEENDDLERISTIHATALVHVGLIQMEAIQNFLDRK